MKRNKGKARATSDNDEDSSGDYTDSMCTIFTLTFHTLNGFQVGMGPITARLNSARRGARLKVSGVLWSLLNIINTLPVAIWQSEPLAAINKSWAPAQCSTAPASGMEMVPHTAESEDLTIMQVDEFMIDASGFLSFGVVDPYNVVIY